MLGSTAVTKAAKKGYKRYGLPGAVVAGGGALLGIRFLKGKLGGSSSGENDEAAADGPDGGSETAN